MRGKRIDDGYRKLSPRNESGIVASFSLLSLTPFPFPSGEARNVGFGVGLRGEGKGGGGEKPQHDVSQSQILF